MLDPLTHNVMRCFAIILMVIVAPRPAMAQMPESEDTVAPATVIIYVPQSRAAPSNVQAVRQRIDRIGGGSITPVYPVIVQVWPAVSEAPPESDATAVTRQDLDRLSRRFDDRLNSVRRLLSASNGTGDDGRVFIFDDEDRALIDSLVSERAEAGDGTEDDTFPDLLMQPTAEEIERTILETGLFRAVDVNFEFDKSVLLPSATPTLDAVADVLVRYPELRIEIAGHTDSVGSEAYNQALSERRAESVRVYLLENFDIAPDRLTSIGFGETRPLMPNVSQTERALNRRVEFELLNPDAAERIERRRIEREDEENGNWREELRDAVREEFRRERDDSDTTRTPPDNTEVPDQQR